MTVPVRPTVYGRLRRNTTLQRSEVKLNGGGAFSSAHSATTSGPALTSS
jgi:hypothetical protein